MAAQVGLAYAVLFGGPTEMPHLGEGAEVLQFTAIHGEFNTQVSPIGDRGLPATLRHMDGFGSHTFSVLRPCCQEG